MEKQVLVNESSLINIADALREKVGEFHMETEMETHYENLSKVSKTHNATSLTTFSGAYNNNLSIYDTVYIEGASTILVQVAYQTESTNYDYLQICAGDQDSFNTSVTKYGGSTRTTKNLTFENTDKVTFYFKSDNSNGNYLGYYAIVTGLDAEGNPILDYTKPFEVPVQVQVRNTFKPNEMANVISNGMSSGLSWVHIAGEKVGDYIQEYDLSSYVVDVTKPTWMLFLTGTYETSSTGNMDARHTYMISPLISNPNSVYNYYIAQNYKKYSTSIGGYSSLYGYNNSGVMGMEAENPKVTFDKENGVITTKGDSTHLLSLNGVLIYM